MISILQGKVSQVHSDRVVFMVSGVGYSVFLTTRHSMKLSVGMEITIDTKLIVREDDMSLFGFQSQAELELFDLLCGVNGIGPKLAMTTLSGLTPELLINAVNNQDEQAFRAIPGIGPKTAKLVLISLSGKVGTSSSPRLNENVLQAMVQLGGDEFASRKLLATLDQSLSESELLKQALAELGKAKLQ